MEFTKEESNENKEKILNQNEESNNNFFSTSLIEEKSSKFDNDKEQKFPNNEKNIPIPKEEKKNHNSITESIAKQYQTFEVNNQQKVVLLDKYKRKKNYFLFLNRCNCLSHEQGKAGQKIFMILITSISFLDIILQLINYKLINTFIIDDIIIPLLFICLLYEDQSICIHSWIGCFAFLCFAFYFFNIFAFFFFFSYKYPKYLFIYFICFLSIKSLFIILLMISRCFIDDCKD